MKYPLLILCLLAAITHSSAYAGSTFIPLKCEGLKDGDARVSFSAKGSTMTTVIKSKHVNVTLDGVSAMSHHVDYGLDMSAAECTPEESPKPCTEWLYPYESDTVKTNRYVINLTEYSGLCTDK